MVAVIGTAAAWMVWQDLAATHLQGLGIDTGFPSRPGVWWWFVPVANLWFPYRIIQATASRIEETNGRGSHSGFITWWWGLWISGFLCWLFGRILALTLSGSSTLAYARNVVRLELAGDICLVAAALLAVAIVGRITAGLGFAEQHRRHEAAAAATATTHV